MTQPIETFNSVGEEDCTFNFNKWVLDNELSDIKHLLLKHGLTTIDALSLQSSQCTQFTADPEVFTKFPQFISKTIIAMQQIAASNKPSSGLTNDYLVIAEEEHAVMESIKTNIKLLDTIEIDVDSLKEIYPKSFQRIKEEKLKQIENTESKINKLFNEINNSLQIKKQILLKSLYNIKQNIQENDEKDDDNKENDLMSKSIDILQNERQYLSNQLEKCENIIKTSNNEDRHKRKQKIMEIGQGIKQKFNKIQKELNKNTEIVKHTINENNDCVINIDLTVNVKEQEKLSKAICNIAGIIIEHDGNNDDNDDNDDNDNNDNDNLKGIRSLLSQDDDGLDWLNTDNDDEKKECDDNNNSVGVNVDEVPIIYHPDYKDMIKALPTDIIEIKQQLIALLNMWQKRAANSNDALNVNQIKAGLNVLRFYINNVIKQPHHETTRKIIIYNKQYQEKMSILPRIETLLTLIGYEKDNTWWILPLLYQENNEKNQQLHDRQIAFLTAFKELLTNLFNVTVDDGNNDNNPPQAPYSKKFAEIAKLIAEGKKPDDIEKYDDMPPDPNAPPSESKLIQANKPWRKNENDDEIELSFLKQYDIECHKQQINQQNEKMAELEESLINTKKEASELRKMNTRIGVKMKKLKNAKNESVAFKILNKDLEKVIGQKMRQLKNAKILNKDLKKQIGELHMMLSHDDNNDNKPNDKDMVKCKACKNKMNYIKFGECDNCGKINCFECGETYNKDVHHQCSKEQSFWNTVTALYS